MDAKSMVYEISVRAIADVRSVRKFLAGEPLKTSTCVRIERAIRELGLDPDTLRVEWEGK